MSARIVLVLRWIAALVLVMAVALIIARWKLPMPKTSNWHSKSTWQILKELWVRFKQRAREMRERASDIAAVTRKRIILVGQEDKYLRALRWNLEALRCEVIQARTGTQALSIINNHRPDAVIADVLLPDMSARDFMELLDDKILPIAFLTTRQQHLEQISRLDSQVVCVGDISRPDQVLVQLGRLLKKRYRDQHKSANQRQNI
ncbi:MAG: response regulator [Armatimonadota bacterium]